MAEFHLQQQVVSLGRGGSAVAYAAYRHGAEMVATMSGCRSSYQNKSEVVHTEFVVPSNAPAWAKSLGDGHRRRRDPVLDRGPSLTPGPENEGAFGGLSKVGKDATAASEAFWNRVEASETRSDAAFAHEADIALPLELDHGQRIALVREYVDEFYTRHGKVADWAYHASEGNPHIHIMSSLRPLEEDGFGPKTIPLRNEDGTLRRKGSKNTISTVKWAGGRQELLALREGWATLANVHLARAGHEVRISHESYQARGIATIPQRHRGPAVSAMERAYTDTSRERDNDEDRTTQYQRFMSEPETLIEHLGKEHASFGDRDISRLVWRYANDAGQHQALMQQVGASEALVPIQSPIQDPLTGRDIGEARYTVWNNLACEERLADGADRLTSGGQFAVKAKALNAAVRNHERTQGFAFSATQMEALEHVAGPSALSVVAGHAGAGKSTVMAGVRKAYANVGRDVVGGAPTGKAARGLTESAGIPSRTLASWERSWSRGQDRLERGSVFVLDEAGMVDSAQMERVVQRVLEADAKLVLVGDARQLQPVGAGAAFRMLADVAGYTELTEIRRQRVDWQVEASQSFARGDGNAAVAAYLAGGRVSFASNRAEAREGVLANWHSDTSAGHQAMMLAHANADVNALNEGARTLLKGDGTLGEETVYATARGARSFAIGDRVVFLSNDRQLDVQNGRLGVVEAIGKQRVENQKDDPESGGRPAFEPCLEIALDGGGRATITPSRYAELDHGYATTIHKSQGATLDQVHVLGTSGLDAQLTYVAMTRHRDDVSLTIASDTFKDFDRGETLSRTRILSRLAQSRQKDVTRDYVDHPDHRLSVEELVRLRGEAAVRMGLDPQSAERVDAFNERRGFPRIGELRAEVLAALGRLRDRVSTVGDRLLKALRERGRFGDTLDRFVQHQPIRVPEQSSSRSPAALQLDLTPTTRAALERLSSASKMIHPTRGADRRFGRQAAAEMAHPIHGRGIRAFNAQVRSVVSRETILASGPSAERAAAIMAKPGDRTLGGAVKERLLNLWPLIYAGQEAERAVRVPDLTDRPKAASRLLQKSRDGLDQSAKPLTAAPQEKGPQRQENEAPTIRRDDTPLEPVAAHADDTIPASEALFASSSTSRPLRDELAVILRHLEQKNGWRDDLIVAATQVWSDTQPIARAFHNAASHRDDTAFKDLIERATSDPSTFAPLRGRSGLFADNHMRSQARQAIPDFVRVARTYHTLVAGQADQIETGLKAQREVLKSRLRPPSKDVAGQVRTADQGRSSPAPNRELARDAVVFAKAIHERFPFGRHARDVQALQLDRGFVQVQGGRAQRRLVEAVLRAVPQLVANLQATQKHEREPEHHKENERLRERERSRDHSRER